MLLEKLVQKGKITQKQLDDGRSRGLTDDQLLSKLVEKGVITQEQLNAGYAKFNVVSDEERARRQSVLDQANATLEANQQQFKPNMVESGAGGLAKGATLGYNDEIVGGIQSFTHGTSYDSEVAKQRTYDSLLRESNPIAYGTGNIVGGVAPYMALPVTGVGLAAAPIMGAIQGIGESDGQNVVQNAAIGGALNLPYFKALSKGSELVSNKILHPLLKGKSIVNEAGNLADDISEKAMEAANIEFSPLFGKPSYTDLTPIEKNDMMRGWFDNVKDVKTTDLPTLKTEMEALDLDEMFTDVKKVVNQNKNLDLRLKSLKAEAELNGNRPETLKQIDNINQKIDTNNKLLRDYGSEYSFAKEDQYAALSNKKENYDLPKAREQAIQQGKEQATAEVTARLQQKLDKVKISNPLQILSAGGFIVGGLPIVGAGLYLLEALANQLDIPEKVMKKIIINPSVQKAITAIENTDGYFKAGDLDNRVGALIQAMKNATLDEVTTPTEIVISK